jgi:hypothetical protein
VLDRIYLAWNGFVEYVISISSRESSALSSSTNVRVALITSAGGVIRPESHIESRNFITSNKLATLAVMIF